MSSSLIEVLRPSGIETRRVKRACGREAAVQMNGYGDEAPGLRVEMGAPLLHAAADGQGSAVSISIEQNDGSAVERDGITIFETDHSAAYVQPLVDGVRFLTAVDSREAGDTLSYKFDVPEGSRLQDVPGGITILVDPNEKYIGTLQPAWAKDSAGRDLETSYEWSDGTLTQRVE